MQRVVIHFMVVASCPGHGARPSRGEQQTLCPETLWLEDVLRFHGKLLQGCWIGHWVKEEKVKW